MNKLSVRRVVQASALGIALIGATILATPTAALANSLSCAKGFLSSAEGYYGNCTGGAPQDQFRPYVVCALAGHANTTRYGVWKHNGLTDVYCPTGYDAISGNLQFSAP